MLSHLEQLEDSLPDENLIFQQDNDPNTRPILLRNGSRTTASMLCNGLLSRRLESDREFVVRDRKKTWWA
uniref:Uncharacterized protein n=1 Tax=Ditylenchus dipsaci TaxID=166011 RepID=A0A915EF56_9BILA